MGNDKPRMVLVTPDNMKNFKPNPQSRKSVAKGDKEYEEMKEALRQLIAKNLNIESEDVR